MKAMVVTVAAAALALVLAAPATGAAGGSLGPAERLRALGEALNRGDVDAAVAMFAADGSVQPATQGGEAFVGRDRVRVWAERLVGGHFRVVFLPNPTVAGNRVTWRTDLYLDQWRDLGVAPAAVLVQVEVDGDGLVRTFSSGLTAESQARVAAGTSAVALVDRLFAALNAGDIEATVALLDSEVVIVGALGDRINGLAEARAYYERLIVGNLRLTPAGSPIVAGDRVTRLYGLGVDSLRAMGVQSAETVGEFYIRDGKIARIIAHFLPNTQAAVTGGR